MATKDWREVRRDDEVNWERVALYDRVFEAGIRAQQMRIAQLRRARGVDPKVIADAVGIDRPDVTALERNESITVPELAEYVAAVGGELELRAVFPNETITLVDPQAKLT